MSAPVAPDLVEIRIVGLPVDVYRDAAEHNDELMREFALIAADAAETAEPAVPARLLALVEELRARFADFTSQPSAELESAVTRGDATLDLVYRVPADIAGAAADLDGLLEEADEFCRTGDLLTMTATRETTAFRRWFLNEFVRQAGGEAPAPWPGTPAN